MARLSRSRQRIPQNAPFTPGPSGGHDHVVLTGNGVTKGAFHHRQHEGHRDKQSFSLWIGKLISLRPLCPLWLIRGPRDSTTEPWSGRARPRRDTATCRIPERRIKNPIFQPPPGHRCP